MSLEKFCLDRQCFVGKNFIETDGLYYKPMMIVNDDARIVNKLDASLTDDSRVVIYDRHMFILQAKNLSIEQVF